MKALAQFTEAGLLVPKLSGDHQDNIILELSHRLEDAGRIKSAHVFAQAVLAHDAQATMVFDNVAFPMGRSETVKEVSFALGLTSQPMPWGSLRTPSIRMIVLIAVPLLEDTSFLVLIPAFAKLLKNQAALSKIQSCARPEGIFDVLCGAPC